ncbi:D-lactate dehydrogenase [Aureimonas sp. N4]|uniref:D-lactate dehydrogenase n=1 Tax=Aureimonas sp. N4 TaxID=1638165 RepID=UPI0009E95936|nr:D-lactate dehydrogenase [Aureimonas sp. N4]
MTETLIARLRAIAGEAHVHVGTRATRRFRTGYRYGDGEIAAAVQPGSLVEQWRVLQACVEADVAVILQAANTGLTGGSTPFGTGYDRPIVIINTMRLKRIDLIRDGAQVLCLPGATLESLERKLKPLGREPHSVIGSSCIGASVTGGICNNSGGSLVQRGPAFTQLALFARVNEAGRLELVNHLGVELGETPEAILARLDAGTYSSSDIHDENGAWASDREYATYVRDIEASTPARFNADPRRHYEASGSAGKIAVFALRMDTFVAEPQEQVFYVGTNDPAVLQQIRRHVLGQFQHLPIAGEYMHSDAFRAAQTYGKDLFVFIRRFGSVNVPRAFAAKSWFDGVTEALGLGKSISDHLLQRVSRLLPEHLPQRLIDYRDRYTHHLILRTGGEGIAEMRDYLSSVFTTGLAAPHGGFLECTEDEGQAALLNRFVSGGAVVRYRAVHRDRIEDIVALDVALPRDTRDWFETLPPEIDKQIALKFYVGHFLCQVMHQEYLVHKGVDCEALEHAILETLEARGAEYPAEHNVGHLYEAKPALKAFYRQLDPTNSFNPGIGKTSRLRGWAAVETTGDGSAEACACEGSVHLR